MVLSESPDEVGPIGTLRWAFRFWLLFSITWVAFVGQTWQHDLCAAYRWNTPKETADGEALLVKRLAARGVSSEAKTMMIADHEKFRGPFPERACFPTSFNEDEVRRAGGYSIDWSERRSALSLWLLPPLVVWLLGITLLWVAGAFQPLEE